MGMEENGNVDGESGENREKSVEFLGGGERISIRMGRNRWSKFLGDR